MSRCLEGRGRHLVEKKNPDMKKAAATHCGPLTLFLKQTKTRAGAGTVRRHTKRRRVARMFSRL